MADATFTNPGIPAGATFELELPTDASDLEIQLPISRREESFLGLLEVETGPEADWSILNTANKDYLDERYVVKGF